MFGTNPIRPPEKGDGSILYVKSIFPTLQGEGPYAGWPAVFVRLGGCNLACDFCDTDFENFEAMPIKAVENEVWSLRGLSPVSSAGMTQQRHNELVVITGGEPFRQNIAPLCEALIARGMRVQIETNGTLWRELPDAVEIVCSPKNTGPIRPDLLKRVNAFKFLLSKYHPSYREVPEVGQSAYNTPVYVQPMDEHDPAKNAANLAYAAEMAQKHGYRLSLQLHKIVGIP